MNVFVAGSHVRSTVENELHRVQAAKVFGQEKERVLGVSGASALF